MDDLDKIKVCPPPERVGHKRGKKKKPHIEVYDPLPPEATEGKDAEVVKELLQANQILQVILKLKNIHPFYDQPNADSFGMSSYYKIVKEPMWLFEIKRKLNGGDYNGLSDFVKDMRLLLENCYRFWGADHRITKKGLLMEHKLEQKLLEIPKAMLDKLNQEIPYCAQEDKAQPFHEMNLDNGDNANDVPEFVDIEDFDETVDLDKSDSVENDLDIDRNDDSNFGIFEEDSTSSIPSKAVVYYSTNVFKSKILDRVLENGNEEEEDEESEEAKELIKKMLSWERETLVNEEIELQIRKMWELAEIGHFLKLTFEVLNVEEMTQYEVERMLLMPRESTTLMTLMTSMLSPEIKRPALDESPLMPYEVWTGKLSRKVEEWLGVFYLSDDRLKTFEKIGVEPYFWDVIRLTNPLTDKRFHEISFYQRVHIFKSLCNNLLHTNKTIQDIFNEETVHLVKNIRPTHLGKDVDGNKYISLPFLPEIRIYKETKILSKNLSQWRTQEGYIFKLQKFHMEATWSEEDQQINFMPSEMFCLLANDIDSLVALIEESKENELFDLVDQLNDFLKEVETYKMKSEGLKALYYQWHKYQNRSPEYFTNMLNLWLRTEKPVIPKAKSVNSELGDLGEGSNSVLGKRRSATVTFTGYNSEADKFFDSDYEDWETVQKKKRKRGPKKKKEAKEAKEKKDTSTTNEDSILSENQSDITPDPTEFEETKPTLTELKIYSEKIKEPPKTENNTHTPSIRLVPLAKIKEEKDDVICISSDEEKEEVKAPKQIKNTLVVGPGTKPIQQQVTVQQVTLLNQPQMQKQVFVPVPATQVTPVRMQQMRMPQNDVRPRVVTIQSIRAPQPNMFMQNQRPQRVMMPSPIKPVSMPHPIPMAGAAPQQTWQRSPRQPMQYSPRIRTPTTPTTPNRIRTPNTPTTPNRRMNSPRQGTPRALFNSPNRVQQRPVPAPMPAPPMASSDTIEGTLAIGSDLDGTLRYRVKLSDGGIINLSRAEIEDIRRRHNGILPERVNVPLIKRKSF